MVRIGEVAQQTGVPARTLRFYEVEGLLADPGRTDSGYRDYPPSVVARVRFIKRAQAAGLTLEQIGVVLATRDGGQPPCAHVQGFVADRLADVERRLAELTEVRASLLDLQHRVDRLDPAECEEAAICVAIPPDDRPRR